MVKTEEQDAKVKAPGPHVLCWVDYKTVRLQFYKVGLLHIVDITDKFAAFFVPFFIADLESFHFSVLNYQILHAEGETSIAALR